MDITPEIQAMIDAKVTEATAASTMSLEAAKNEAEALAIQMEDEKNKILESKNSVLDEKKILQEQLKSFDGLDAKELIKLKKMVDESEESELLQQGRFDEVVNRRTEKLRLAHEQSMAELQSNYTDLQSKSERVTSAFEEYKIQLAVNTAANTAGALNTAIPDIVNRSKGLFSIDSDGQIYQRDEHGDIRKDKTGKALDPSQFISNLQREAPHFWPESKSANLKGAKTSEVEDRLSAAVESGDMGLYRKLRKSMQAA